MIVDKPVSGDVSDDANTAASTTDDQTSAQRPSEQPRHGKLVQENAGEDDCGEGVDEDGNGVGTRMWPNGNQYSGEYFRHKRHGQGEFTFSNGSVFKGRFDENKFIHGTYTWPNGRVYDGQWNNIYRHGTGKYRWPDGRSYVGAWKDDKRHGMGKYSWADGDYYEGEFVDGKRCGKGTLWCVSGDVYEQEWDEQKFQEFHKGIEPIDSEEEVVMPKNRKKRNRDAAAPDATNKIAKTLSEEWMDVSSHAMPDSD